jgi:hypothetical protein
MNSKLFTRGGIMTEREQSKWKEHADEAYTIFDAGEGCQMSEE